MSLQTGSILNNRYRIVTLLGQGGFGAVYRAWDLNLRRPCAVKENFETSPQAQGQFQVEASLLANLHHPNLPRVIDHFILPGKGQYLVMDFIEGDDLQAILDQSGGPLSESQVIPWIEQICDALKYLHSQNPPIIHRDIKPANIRITSDGRAFLVDFGIAKVYDPATNTVTAAQAITPGFSPPEQYGQGSTGPRTDIYALGATIYTLLTGQVPVESLQRIARDPLVPAEQLNPHLSIHTSAAIHRAMQIDPDMRFQNDTAFKAALNSAQPVIATPSVSQPAHLPPANMPLANLKHFQSPLLWLVSGAILVLVCVAIYWSLASSSLLSSDLPVSQPTAVVILLDDTATSLPVLLVVSTPELPSLTPGQISVDIASNKATDTPAPSATPSPTPTPESSWQQGKLVFVARQGGGTALYTLDLAADGEPQLFYSPGSDTLLLAPSWSPDGSRIAYHQYGDYLQVIDMSGGTYPRNLQICSVASWSADGSQIVCKNVSKGTFDILDAGNGALVQRVPVDSGAVLPAWSPVRDELAYVVSNSEGTRIWSLALNSDLPALLAGEAYENYAPSWSPDGEWIAYQSTLTSALSEVWIMDRNGNNRRQITTTPGGAWSRAPSWSPDGKWLAFVSNREQSIGADYGEIYVISLETGEMTRITNTGGKVYDWRVSWGQ